MRFKELLEGEHAGVFAYVCVREEVIDGDLWRERNWVCVCIHLDHILPVCAIHRCI